MCKEVQLSASEPDLEVKHDTTPIRCYVWRKSATTMRVTIFGAGVSRVFDATRTRIRERRD